jgi:hypothetical protein
MSLCRRSLLDNIGDSSTIRHSKCLSSQLSFSFASEQKTFAERYMTEIEIDSIARVLLQRETAMGDFTSRSLCTVR